MAGLKIVLPTSFSDTSLSMLRDDAILTVGSLVLHDVVHSADPWAGGVPANGYAIPNIAWKECSAVLGSGTQSSLKSSLVVAGAISNNTKGKLERSGKNGLHVIVSQANALSANDGVTFTLPSALRTYIAANTTHRFYFSLWDYFTRANPNPSSAPLAMFEIAAGSTSFQLITVRSSDFNFPGGSGNSRAVPGLNSVGSRYISGGNLVDHNLTTSNFVPGGPEWGAVSSTYNNAVLASRNGNWPSSIFYRMYLEDLTVSGRTYSQVDAIDYALYTAAVTTSGGRYYGDTFTAPSTVP